MRIFFICRLYRCILSLFVLHVFYIRCLKKPALCYFGLSWIPVFFCLFFFFFCNICHTIVAIFVHKQVWLSEIIFTLFAIFVSIHSWFSDSVCLEHLFPYIFGLLYLSLYSCGFQISPNKVQYLFPCRCSFQISYHQCTFIVGTQLRSSDITCLLYLFPCSCGLQILSLQGMLYLSLISCGFQITSKQSLSHLFPCSGGFLMLSQQIFKFCRNTITTFRYPLNRAIKLSLYICGFQISHNGLCIICHYAVAAFRYPLIRISNLLLYTDRAFRYHQQSL